MEVPRRVVDSELRMKERKFCHIPINDHVYIASNNKVVALVSSAKGGMQLNV